MLPLAPVFSTVRPSESVALSCGPRFFVCVPGGANGPDCAWTENCVIMSHANMNRQDHANLESIETSCGRHPPAPVCRYPLLLDPDRRIRFSFRRLGRSQVVRRLGSCSRSPDRSKAT